MENEVDQYYMDLAEDHDHEHWWIEYLSNELPALHEEKAELLLTMCSTHTFVGVWTQSAICCT